MDQFKETLRLDMNSAYLGVSRLMLMENAGREVARECERYNSIAFFCGMGNNGGDGFAAARHLSSLGKKVSVFALEGDKSFEAEKNFSILKKLDSVEIILITDSKDCDYIKKKLDSFDVIVDALLGVGATGEPREPIKSLVELINSAKPPKIAVDVPTPGLKADIVVSFHNPKTEKAKVVSIGIPKEAETNCGPGDVYAAIPQRKGTEHKGDFGRLLVIGGSKEYLGAPALVGKAAQRCGIDLVFTACPKYVAANMPKDPTDIIIPLNSENYLEQSDLDIIEKINFDAVVVGNGIGLNSETKSFVRELTRKLDKPTIIDADALKLIEPRHLRDNHIITPHAAEYKILFGESSATLQDNAKKTKATIVLKGPVDVISNSLTTKINKTGNPGMTVGGTGDVLAGIIGALATKTNLFDSACAGAFLSGLSGDLAADRVGYSLTALDVIEYIPDAIKYCKQYR
jgi:hydroxyethylthiazole kinase-like uncharacterized protein yjeF